MSELSDRVKSELTKNPEIRPSELAKKLKISASYVSNIKRALGGNGHGNQEPEASVEEVESVRAPTEADFAAVTLPYDPESISVLHLVAVSEFAKKMGSLEGAENALRMLQALQVTG